MHRLNSGQWFPKSRTFLFFQNSSGKKGNSELSKSLRKSIEDFYDTGNINHNQLTKSYKIAVSFVLSNADFPPLPTVFQLHATFINALSDKHISNITTVTPFS